MFIVIYIFIFKIIYIYNIILCTNTLTDDTTITIYIYIYIYNIILCINTLTDDTTITNILQCTSPPPPPPLMRPLRSRPTPTNSDTASSTLAHPAYRSDARDDTISDSSGTSSGYRQYDDRSLSTSSSLGYSSLDIDIPPYDGRTTTSMLCTSPFFNGSKRNAVYVPSSSDYYDDDAFLKYVHHFPYEHNYNEMKEYIRKQEQEVDDGGGDNHGFYRRTRNDNGSSDDDMPLKLTDDWSKRLSNANESMRAIYAGRTIAKKIEAVVQCLADINEALFEYKHSPTSSDNIIDVLILMICNTGREDRDFNSLLYAHLTMLIDMKPLFMCNGIENFSLVQFTVAFTFILKFKIK